MNYCVVVQMLVMNREDNHQQPQSQSITSAPTIGRNLRERQKKPRADMEMTGAKWRVFLNQWARYKWSSGVSGQDIVDDLMLCLPDKLRLEVNSELGDVLENITEENY